MSLEEENNNHPIVIVALGAIPKVFRTYLANILLAQS